MDKLAQLIEHASSLTEGGGGAKAALNEFSRILISELQAGNWVHPQFIQLFY